MFSFEICEVLKNTYFEEHLRTTASGVCFCYNKLEAMIKLKGKDKQIYDI